MEVKNLTELYEKYKSDERRKILKLITSQSINEAILEPNYSLVPKTTRHKITRFDIDFLIKSVKLEHISQDLNSSENKDTSMWEHKLQNQMIKQPSRVRFSFKKENKLIFPKKEASSAITTFRQKRFHFGPRIDLKRDKASSRPSPLSKQDTTETSVVQEHSQSEHLNPPTSARPHLSEQNTLASGESEDTINSNDLSEDSSSTVQIAPDVVDQFIQGMTHETTSWAQKERSVVDRLSRMFIPQLPFILEEFSDDINPKEFFKQNYSSYINFLTEIRKLSPIDPLISIQNFSLPNGSHFNSMSFSLKANDQVVKVVFIPFSIAYLLMHCTKAVKLCFANTMFMEILKNKKASANRACFRFCSEVLSGLAKEEEAVSVMSFSSRRTLARKSMFSMLKTTLAVEDEPDEDDSDEEDKADNSGQLSNVVVESHLPVENAQFVKTSLMVIKAESEEKESRSDSGSESEDNSSASSKSGSSLEEEEYGTKNKFELMYSEITFKFQRYKISVNEPFVIYQGARQLIERDLVYAILGNRGSDVCAMLKEFKEKV